jgi:hypothetical protein
MSRARATISTGDTFTLGSNNLNLGLIGGSIAINAQTPNKTLYLQDQTAPTGQVYNLDQGSFIRGATQIINGLSGISALALYGAVGGSSSNIFKISPNSHRLANVLDFNREEFKRTPCA